MTLAYDNQRAFNGGGSPARNTMLSPAEQAIIDRMKGMSDGGSAGANGAANGDSAYVDQSKQRLQDLTEGRANSLATDPRMNSAMDYLGQVMSGAKGPYDQATQDAMLGKQAGANAAAQAAQMQALQEQVAANGGSLSDPSYQAKAQEMMGQRQGRNLDALGNIMQVANQANFNASQQAANGLAAMRNAQNAQINQMDLAGANYRAQAFAQLPGNGGMGGNRSMSFYGSSNPTPNGGSVFPQQQPYGQTGTYGGNQPPQQSAPRIYSGTQPAQSSNYQRYDNSPMTEEDMRQLRQNTAGYPGGYGATYSTSNS